MLDKSHRSLPVLATKRAGARGSLRPVAPSCLVWGEGCLMLRRDRRTESLRARASQSWELVLEGPSVLPATSLLQTSISPTPWLKMSFDC